MSPVYKLDATVSDEILCLEVIRHWLDTDPSYKAKNPRLPPGVDLSTASARDIEAAVTQDPARQTIDLASLQDEIDHAGPIISAYCQLFDLPLPGVIPVHVTVYGCGGSYHPVQRHSLSRTEAAISVMAPSVAASRKMAVGFIGNIVHETIHLLIEEPVVQHYGLSDEEKEALVDRLCSCKELVPAVGSYPVRSGLAPYFKPEWITQIPWRKQPSW